MNCIEFNYHLKKANNSYTSLKVIYNYYYGRIILFITQKYNGGDYIAKDVAQEFFLYILNLKKIPYINNPTAWVYKCCDHIASKILKTERTYDEIDENFIASDLYIEDTLYGDLDVYVKQLDEITQKIIKMIYVDGYKAREVSKFLDIKYGTIRQKHARGIKKIKSLQKSVTKLKK